MWRTRVKHLVGPLIAVVLFAGALWVLHQIFRNYHYRDLVASIAAIPGYRVWAAIGLAVLGYIVLTGYDSLGFLYVRRPLHYLKVAAASFISYAFSHNLGFGVVTGNAVRYRLYSSWGLSAEETVRIIAFVALTFWLGFFTLAGVTFIVQPPVLPPELGLGITAARPLGVAFLALVALYLVWTGTAKKPLRIRGWEFPQPPVWLSLAEIAVSCADWALAAGVLYVLLPSSTHVNFSYLLAVFMLAQVAALIAHVPGGLGVFETVVVLLLREHMEIGSVLGSLLVFRAVYYFLPFFVAILLLGVHEVFLQRHWFGKIADSFEAWIGPFIPQLFAFTTLLGGAILLFSGATPAVRSRLEWLRTFLPLPVLEVSHFVGSLTGAALLLLARGIQKRLDLAYPLTVGLLVVGIITSLLKGFDYEEAIALTVMLLVFLPCRRHFYRKASLSGRRFTLGWSTAVVVIILCTVWLGFFSYQHFEYKESLWWKFSFTANAPRTLRAGVGVAAVVLFFAAARLFRPAPPEPVLPTARDLERARSIIQQSPLTIANAALLADKPLLFNQQGTAFLMYAVQQRSWVALGGPIGPAGEHADLAWRFHELADLHDGWTVFHQVAPPTLPLCLDLGLNLVKVGEQARVRLESFALEGSTGKPFRQIHNKFEREGCAFEVVSPSAVRPLLPRLREISDHWLKDKHATEKRFSIGFFDEAYLANFPVALVRREDRIFAFANLWLGAGHEEVSVDLMRHLKDAPHGVMDYLFSQLMLWGKAEGYRWFDLGMAPLAGLENRPLSPPWMRLGSLIFRHGEAFYNFQGLRYFKDKFNPVWEPRYLAYPGGLTLPRILADLAALISGGLRRTLRSD